MGKMCDTRHFLSLSSSCFYLETKSNTLLGFQAAYLLWINFKNHMLFSVCLVIEFIQRCAKILQILALFDEQNIIISFEYVAIW
jgi:hypothetical protein